MVQTVKDESETFLSPFGGVGGGSHPSPLTSKKPRQWKRI